MYKNIKIQFKNAEISTKMETVLFLSAADVAGRTEVWDLLQERRLKNVW